MRDVTVLSQLPRAQRRHLSSPTETVSNAIFDGSMPVIALEIVAVKSLCVAIALLFIQCWPAGAVDQNCMTEYYRTKPPGCVDAMLAQLRQTAPGLPDISTAIGFLAQVFSTSPAEKQRILSGESSPYVRSVDLLALYRAGLIDDAQKFASENQLPPVLAKIDASRVAPLATVKPSSNPADNDLLIGAYMASGDTTLIERILGNFSGLDDETVSDALRMGLVTSNFGPSLTPKGRENVMAPAGCAKYQCKPDPTKYLRVLTLSSAFWALQSLAQRDESVRKAFYGFFTSDPRMNKLLAAEQAAFSTYTTALFMVSAIKPEQVSKDDSQTYEAMSKAALAFEKLEPARDVFSYTDGLVKSGKQPKN